MRQAHTSRAAQCYCCLLRVAGIYCQPWETFFPLNTWASAESAGNGDKGDDGTNNIIKMLSVALRPLADMLSRMSLFHREAAC